MASIGTDTLSQLSGLPQEARDKWAKERSFGNWSNFMYIYNNRWSEQDRENFFRQNDMEEEAARHDTQPTNVLGKATNITLDDSGKSLKDFPIYDSIPNFDAIKDSVSPLNSFSSELSHDYNGIDLASKFLAYRQHYADDPLITGYSYLFMTKPNLNLNPEGNSTSSTTWNTSYDGFFRYIKESYPQLMYDLNYSITNQKNNSFFIKLLSNKFETISGINDIDVSTVTSTETKNGFKIFMPTSYAGSINGGTCNISYVEPDPPIIMYMHKLWIDYMEKVKFGEMEPSKETLKNKELDYTSSIYYFILGPDGQTIKFWCKLFGVFPKSLPYTSLISEMGNRSIVKGDYSYAYSFVRYLDVQDLFDFNKIAMKTGYSQEILENNNQSSDNFKLFGDLFSFNFYGNLANGININNSIESMMNSASYKSAESQYAIDSGIYDSAIILKSGKDFKLIFVD